jgi:hypothetical protein
VILLASGATRLESRHLKALMLNVLATCHTSLHCWFRSCDTNNGAFSHIYVYKPRKIGRTAGAQGVRSGLEAQIMLNGTHATVVSSCDLLGMDQTVKTPEVTKGPPSCPLGRS